MRGLDVGSMVEFTDEHAKCAVPLNFEGLTSGSRVEARILTHMVSFKELVVDTNPSFISDFADNAPDHHTPRTQYIMMLFKIMEVGI